MMRPMRGGARLQRAAVVALALVLCAAAGPAEVAEEGVEEPRVVSQGEILAAMRECQGYALTATANGARLQVEVLLQLIRHAEESDPDRRPLYVGHREWYEAFLERTGLGPDDAPLYVRTPYEVGQDLIVDYRRERVIEEVRQGPEPRTVANVRIFWPDAPGAPKKFSYDDYSS